MPYGDRDGNTLYQVNWRKVYKYRECKSNKSCSDIVDELVFFSIEMLSNNTCMQDYGGWEKWDRHTDTAGQSVELNRPALRETYMCDLGVLSTWEWKKKRKNKPLCQRWSSFRWQKTSALDLIHLLSSSVMTIMGSLLLPPPLAVDANTVML